PPETTDVVAFGSRVTIERNDGRTQTFTIVGEDEADPKAGTLSFASPLARALMGKGVGDVAVLGEAEVESVELGPVDKVDAHTGFPVIQDCFLGGGFGAWGFVGRRVAAHWRALAG